MKRGRNQRRRQGTNPNRAFDSNGPDVRIRGTANQIFDKYQALARDASSAGDRVKAENYLQHAEHYFRVMRAMQPAPPPQEQPDLDGASPSAASADQEAPSREREPANGGRRRGARAANGAETDSKNVTENEAALEGAPAVAKEDAPVNEGASEAVDAKETEEERPRPRRKRRARPTKAEAAAAEESKEEATAG